MSTSQQCNSGCSPCTCSEAPLLSFSGWRSLNDLQISLIFQGPRPFRVLPGRLMVVVVLTVFLYLLPHYPSADHDRSIQTTLACRHRRGRCRTQPGIRHRVFFSLVCWRTHKQDSSATTSEKSTPIIHQYCCDGHDGVRSGPEVNLFLSTYAEGTQMAAACEAVVNVNGRLRGL